MHSRASLPVALLAASALLLSTVSPELARVAEAAPSAQARARAADLKKQGDDAMVTLRYAEAIDAYTKAYEITGDPALLYNRGRALQGLGQFPEALEQLESFKTKASSQLKARVPALDSLIAEVRGKIATVTIKSNVQGARILVRKKIVGETPLRTPLSLNAGSALVELEAEGYFPYKKTIELPGGGKVEVDAALSSKNTTGLLVIRSKVPGARVFVNGKSVGNVPVEISVPAGTHKIVVDREGYEKSETSAVVGVGDRKQVSVDLKENASIASRWWFWTGIGVVVAGGAVVAGALLLEQPASEGDIEPGQVAAPLRF